MNIKFIEKLVISIVIFLGVVITTAFIIGHYVSIKQEAEDKKNNSIILGNINVF